jgi:four helix bundle protein
MSQQFQVLELAIALIPELKPLVEQIAKYDRDLANQLRRSGSGIPLSISEGSRRQGKDRMHQYRIAAGSAAEARTTLAVARGWGYVDLQSAQAADQMLDRILAMLWRASH